MAKTTGIQWAGATWNPWYGCRKVSAGCVNCYAERWAKRAGRDFSQVTRAADATFYAPLKWKEPGLIFVCSLGDFFFDGSEIGDYTGNIRVVNYWRSCAWDVMRQSPQHVYLILTKRPENITRMLPPDWGAGWPNVWLGVTVESDKYCYRAAHLTGIPVHNDKRFISYEPAVGMLAGGRTSSGLINLLSNKKIRWLIAGGESGPGARPASPHWFEWQCDECARTGVPFFLKQLGGTRKIDGAFGGYTLPDGSQPRGVPPSLSGFFEE